MRAWLASLLACLLVCLHALLGSSIACLVSCCALVRFFDRRTESGKKTIGFCTRCVAEALKRIQFLVFLIGAPRAARAVYTFDERL